MTKEIAYNGFVVNSFSLEKIKDASKGRFVTKTLNQSIETFDGSDEETPFVYNISVEMRAYDGDEDDDSLCYILLIDVDVRFSHEDANIKINEEFEQENGWFLNRYIYTSMKFAIEGVLKDTSLSGISLPWS
ncbi:hypothetical protein [Morganella morganii]|uniref:hypothetical protein n=1 Tax=Morganella morganii TaxID=582 RepID=UPI003EC084A5